MLLDHQPQFFDAVEASVELVDEDVTYIRLELRHQGRLVAVLTSTSFEALQVADALRLAVTGSERFGPDGLDHSSSGTDTPF